MKRLIYILFVLPLACVAQKSLEIKEVDHGIYTARTTSETNTNTLSGTYSTLSNIILNVKTDTIPIDKEIWFGIHFMANSNKHTLVELEVVWTFPQPLTNEQGKTFTEIRSKRKTSIGVKSFTGYQLSEKYEQVPGKWTLQLYYKNKLLLEHVFHVVAQQE